MDGKTSSSIALRSATRDGSLEVLRETERLFVRVPAALTELVTLVNDWKDPVAIDDALADLIEAMDPQVEPGAKLATERLEALRVGTRARSDEHRRIRATRRWRRTQ